MRHSKPSPPLHPSLRQDERVKGRTVLTVFVHLWTLFVLFYLVYKSASHWSFRLLSRHTQPTPTPWSIRLPLTLQALSGANKADLMWYKFNNTRSVFPLLSMLARPWYIYRHYNQTPGIQHQIHVLLSTSTCKWSRGSRTRL
jgi:hypothetical protein